VTSLLRQETVLVSFTMKSRRSGSFLFRDETWGAVHDSHMKGREPTHPGSETGSPRNPLVSRKLFGVRETTAPPATRGLPTTLRTKSPSAGNSVHFASKSSTFRRHQPRSPPRAYDRAKKRNCQQGRRDAREHAAERKQTFPRSRPPPAIELVRLQRIFNKAQSSPVSAVKSFGLFTMNLVRFENHG
jgi:hypothetical protein